MINCEKDCPQVSIAAGDLPMCHYGGNSTCDECRIRQWYAAEAEINIIKAKQGKQIAALKAENDRLNNENIGLKGTLTLRDGEIKTKIKTIGILLKQK